jgi:hypothetical protein
MTHLLSLSRETRRGLTKYDLIWSPFSIRVRREWSTPKELRFNTFRVEKSSRSGVVLARLPLQMLGIQLAPHYLLIVICVRMDI